jgi:hypothetical protein
LCAGEYEQVQKSAVEVFQVQVWTDLLPGGAGGPGESLSLICGYLGQGNSLLAWADLLPVLEVAGGPGESLSLICGYLDILAKVTLSKSGQTVYLKGLKDLVL